MKWPAPVALFLMLGACERLPIDQADTLDRIAATHEVRVGLVAAAEQSPHFNQLRTLVDRSSAAAGGRAALTTGASEQLLLQLEAGQLDLVVGEFDSSSPWYQRVHLLPPMAERSEGESRLEATGAARNGENGWIMLLEREARRLTATS